MLKMLNGLLLLLVGTIVAVIFVGTTQPEQALRTADDVFAKGVFEFDTVYTVNRLIEEPNWRETVILSYDNPETDQRMEKFSGPGKHVSLPDGLTFKFERTPNNPSSDVVIIQLTPDDGADQSISIANLNQLNFLVDLSAMSP